MSTLKEHKLGSCFTVFRTRYRVAVPEWRSRKRCFECCFYSDASVAAGASCSKPKNFEPCLYTDRTDGLSVVFRKEPV